MVGRMGAAGMPWSVRRTSRPRPRRLAARLRPRVRPGRCVVLAVTSVTLFVVGPKILGHATDIIIDGIRTTGSTTASSIACCTSRRAPTCAPRSLYVSRTCWPGSCNARCTGCGGRGRKVEPVPSALHRQPTTRRPAQQGHQRHRQLGPEPAADPQPAAHVTLQVLGVVIMMLTISPLLALVALVTIPLSLVIIKFIAKRSRGRFVAQWKHTGCSTHKSKRPSRDTRCEGVRPSRRSGAPLQRHQRGTVRSRVAAQFISGTIQPP